MHTLINATKTCRVVRSKPHAPERTHSGAHRPFLLTSPAHATPFTPRSPDTAAAAAGPREARRRRCRRHHGCRLLRGPGPGHLRHLLPRLCHALLHLRRRVCLLSRRTTGRQAEGFECREASDGGERVARRAIDGSHIGHGAGRGAASGQVAGGAACLVQGLRFPHHIATAVSHARSLVRPLGRTVIM